MYCMTFSLRTNHTRDIVVGLLEFTYSTEDTLYAAKRQENTAFLVLVPRRTSAAKVVSRGRGMDAPRPYDGGRLRILDTQP
jgi:hypothetical protein